MQNVVQNSATESVGNCVKHATHEVGHRGANPSATPSITSTCAKPSNSSHNHCNSVSKSPAPNHSSGTASKGNFTSSCSATTTTIHRPTLEPGRNTTKTASAVKVTESSTTSTALVTDLTLQQRRRRSYHHQYMPDSSDSDCDDVLSVSILLLTQAIIPLSS